MFLPQGAHMDLQVTLGDIISAAGPIVAIVGAYLRLSDRLTSAEFKVNLMWAGYLKALGVQETKGE